MKAQEGITGGQGRPTSDRAFSDQNAEAKKDISNSGGQRPNQTSNRDNDRKTANKRRSIL